MWYSFLSWFGQRALSTEVTLLCLAFPLRNNSFTYLHDKETSGTTIDVALLQGLSIRRSTRHASLSHPLIGHVGAWSRVLLEVTYTRNAGHVKSALSLHTTNLACGVAKNNTISTMSIDVHGCHYHNVHVGLFVLRCFVH